MPDTSATEPPTHYANFVTVSVDPDVAYLELRRIVRPHRDMLAQTLAAPEPATEAIYAQEPIARVVLTYTAAKALQASLNEVLPKMERARRGTERT
jgi:hypothetical protein